MILPGINLLVYAYHAQTPHHREAADWLKGTLASGRPVGLAWPVIWGFLRVSANRRIWPVPMPMDVAVECVQNLLSTPNVSLVQPGHRHLLVLNGVIQRANASGPMVSDAVLAAIAIEHDATLASTDRDFQRFNELRWVTPLAEY